jgi:hypothetical protein
MRVGLLTLDLVRRSRQTPTTRPKARRKTAVWSLPASWQADGRKGQFILLLNEV